MNRVRNMCVALSCVALNVLWADNIITDFEQIVQIELNLKPNQTLVIDHQRGALLGIMEISPTGQIKKLPIPQELIGKSEMDVMGGQSAYKTDVEHFGRTSTTIYSRQDGSDQSQLATQRGIEDLSKGNQKRQSGHEWDKNKIIFEQQGEVLDILR